MPHEKDVIEKHLYWCPKWYWPFAVCTRSGPVHKWCYNFSWVKATAYLFVIHYEACEEGRLYTWSEAGLGIGTLGTYVPVGEMCFDSPRSGGGRCDSSNTGLQASGLSASAPYVSTLKVDVTEKGSHVVESGITSFTEEMSRLCRQGDWRWEKIAREYVATLSVETRFVTIEWLVQGKALSGGAGLVTVGTQVREPGSSATYFRNVTIGWQIVTEANRSTLRLTNDPKDFNYSVLVTAVARDGAVLVKTRNAEVDFAGLTINYDPERLAEEIRCILRYKRQLEKPRLIKVPTPGDPVVVVPDRFNTSLAFLSELDRTVASACLEVMQLAIDQDVALCLAAQERLEEVIALPRLAAMVRIGAAQPSLPAPPAWTRRSTLRLLRWMQAYEANPVTAQEEDCGCWFR